MIADVIDMAAIDAVGYVLQNKAAYRILRKTGFIIIIFLLTIIYICMLCISKVDV